MQSPKAHYHVGMRIIPVLDVMGGIVVRAVAGRRSEYRPLVSKLTTSVEPAEVARTLLAKSGADELRLAADASSLTHPMAMVHSRKLFRPVKRAKS